MENNRKHTSHSTRAFGLSFSLFLFGSQATHAILRKLDFICFWTNTHWFWFDLVLKNKLTVFEHYWRCGLKCVAQSCDRRSIGSIFYSRVPPTFPFTIIISNAHFQHFHLAKSKRDQRLSTHEEQKCVLSDEIASRWLSIFDAFHRSRQTVQFFTSIVSQCRLVCVCRSFRTLVRAEHIVTLMWFVLPSFI